MKDIIAYVMGIITSTAGNHYINEFAGVKPDCKLTRIDISDYIMTIKRLQICELTYSK